MDGYLFDDLLEQLNDVPLYGETLIRNRPVRRISTIHFWVAGVDCPMTTTDAIEFLATARREDDEE